MRPRLRTKSRLSSRLFRPKFPPNFAGMSFGEAHYHPFLFTMMILVGVAEAGLTTFLINAGNAHNTWPSPRYHSFLLFMLFNALWTCVFAIAYMLFLVDGAKHLLANIASSIFWLTVTVTLWVSNCLFPPDILLTTQFLRRVFLLACFTTRERGATVRPRLQYQGQRLRCCCRQGHF